MFDCVRDGGEKGGLYRYKIKKTQKLQNPDGYWGYTLKVDKIKTLSTRNANQIKIIK